MPTQPIGTSSRGYAAGLSEKPPEGGTPVAELAERIKALRDANTVEAAPERTVRKAARAESPVTARIRARLGEQPVAEAKDAGDVKATVVEVPVAEQKPVEKPEEPPAAPPAPVVIAMPEPVKPDYRQSVTRRRQGHEAQLRLF